MTTGLLIALASASLMQLDDVPHSVLGTTRFRTRRHVVSHAFADDIMVLGTARAVHVWDRQTETLLFKQPLPGVAIQIVFSNDKKQFIVSCKRDLGEYKSERLLVTFDLKTVGRSVLFECPGPA